GVVFGFGPSPRAACPRRPCPAQRQAEPRWMTETPQQECGGSSYLFRRPAYLTGFSRPSLVVVLPFFVPSHLDSLELRFVRCLGVIVETVEPHHPFAQVRKPDRERINRWKLFKEGNPDVFRVRPFHGRAPSRSLS